MPMVPPTPPAAPVAPLMTGHSTSAKQGFNPENGQPLPSSAESMPTPELSREEQKYLAVAQGRGLRKGKQVEAESGEPLTLRGPNGVPVGCKYCGVNPCNGVSWVFEGEVRFKCDACGRKQKLGYLETTAKSTREELDGYEKAEYNRRRLWREDDVKREEERQRQMDDIARNPENQHLSALTNRAFVEQNFFS